jgi:lysophospholipase L1-like esterase
MNRLASLSLYLLLFALGTLYAAEPKASPSKFLPASGDTIVFLGDSITAQCLYTQYIENYFYTRYPQLRLHFHNAGVSGDTAADALARFDRDVAAYHPKFVAILLGMNDGAAKVFVPELFERYQADMQQLIAKVRAISAVPILLSPTMYDTAVAAKSEKPDRRGRGGYYNGVLALYGSWLRELADEQNLGFVDLHGPLNQFARLARQKYPGFVLIPDGIHPDPGGQMIMAYLFASDLGLSRRCSTIELSRSAKGEAVAKMTGGKVTEAKFTADGAAFTFAPASLPMSVPEVAKKGADLIPLGHRLSYEALYVHGLAPGRYQLFINDALVGEHPAEVFASKLEIENNEKTPEHQQAVRVAELNAQRNEQVIVPLRDLWRAKKTLERTRQELAAAPGDEALKKRLAAYEKKLSGFDEQLQALDDKARQFEDQIYQANQPQPLHFRLVRTVAEKQ